MPLEVTFTCEAHDDDGPIASYRWDFDGDGQIDVTTTTGETNYTYSAEGMYLCQVWVVDDEEDQSEASSLLITAYPEGGGATRTTKDGQEIGVVPTITAFKVEDASGGEMPPDNKGTPKINVSFTLSDVSSEKVRVIIGPLAIDEDTIF